MQIVRASSQFSAADPCVLTIGNFDGLHRGHAAILAAVRAHARRLGARAVVMTFHPHPLAHIAPERAPTPLSTLEQKIRLIEAQGMDVLLIQAFTAEFARTPAERFVEEHLLGRLNARVLVAGQNFRFGHEHAGSLATLRPWADRLEVIEVPPVAVGRGERVSSSRIRRALRQGDVRTARRMLGRCYAVAGRVVPGAARGRRLTVPTINLAPENPLIPSDGVYLTRIALDGGAPRNALTNIGVRPTFGEGERTIETHVLGGRELAPAAAATLKFLTRLRDEARFESADALLEQIRRDTRKAERYFARAAAPRPGQAPSAAAIDWAELSSVDSGAPWSP